jgi:hypothetical protein
MTFEHTSWSLYWALQRNFIPAWYWLVQAASELTTRSNVWKLKASYFWLLSHMRSSPSSISGGLWHPLMQAQPKTSHFWIWVHPQMMIQWSTGTRKCGTHIYFVTLVCPRHLSASATHFYHRGKKKGAQQLTQSKCSGCWLLLNLISPQIIKARWGCILLTTNMTDPLDLENGLARNNYNAHGKNTKCNEGTNVSVQLNQNKCNTNTGSHNTESLSDHHIHHEWHFTSWHYSRLTSSSPDCTGFNEVHGKIRANNCTKICVYCISGSNGKTQLWCLLLFK